MAVQVNKLATASRNGVVTLEETAPQYRSVTLMIVGQRLTIKTDQEPEVLESMAQEINAVWDTIRKSAPGASAPQVMALTMMQIMERARIAEQQDELHCQVIDRHAQRLEMLLSSLDAAENQK